MITQKLFGTLHGGEAVYVLRIEEADGSCAELLNYGATLRNMTMPDRRGQQQCVVLGYDNLEEYINNDGYFGATVGRYANRIKNASFELNGNTYALFANEGKNTLHGGKSGFDKKIWNYEIIGDNSVKFSYLSADGEEGFPADLNVSVTFTLQQHKLSIEYKADADAPTYINMTNHIYFNLSGEKTIKDHYLKLYSYEYTPTDDNMIPTGEILSVINTPLDFTYHSAIGQNINNDSLKIHKGYDHNYILSKEPDGLAATLISRKSGIIMHCRTTQPALMLYTGNHITRRTGLNGEVYKKFKGVCLEAQHCPDSPHNTHFPQTLLMPGEQYKQQTSYEFIN